MRMWGRACATIFYLHRYGTLSLKDNRWDKAPFHSAALVALLTVMRCFMLFFLVVLALVGESLALVNVDDGLSSTAGCPYLMAGTIETFSRKLIVDTRPFHLTLFVRTPQLDAMTLGDCGYL